MQFEPLKLAGATLITPNPIEDERGFFARSWCQQEFGEQGLNPDLVQCNISFNHKAGTLRGMHFQTAPHAEAKLVRVTQGKIYDVIIDLRPESDTHTQWLAVELSAENRQMLYIPEGVAHGFQTLADNTEVFYQMSEVYHPECASGLRWDDPAFDVAWPEPESGRRIISEKDQAYPDFAATAAAH